jgi:predicted neutral ceramidase superfamily lipid hydrolase
MGASAIVMGAAGVAGLFLPQEIAAALGVSASGLLPSLLQIHAAMLLGFAMINWMAKDSLIGGIYNRPVLVGNVAHFAIGAITLLKVVAGNATPPLIAATVIYVIFAVGFGMLMFSSPVKSSQQV